MQLNRLCESVPPSVVTANRLGDVADAQENIADLIVLHEESLKGSLRQRHRLKQKYQRA